MLPPSLPQDCVRGENPGATYVESNNVLHISICTFVCLFQVRRCHVQRVGDPYSRSLERRAAVYSA